MEIFIASGRNVKQLQNRKLDVRANDLGNAARANFSTQYTHAYKKLWMINHDISTEFTIIELYIHILFPLVRFTIVILILNEALFYFLYKQIEIHMKKATNISCCVFCFFILVVFATFLFSFEFGSVIFTIVS